MFIDDLCGAALLMIKALGSVLHTPLAALHLGSVQPSASIGYGGAEVTHGMGDFGRANDQAKNLGCLYEAFALLEAS